VRQSGAAQLRLLIWQRLGLREAELDVLEDDDFAVLGARALWLEEREVEMLAQALARVLPKKG